jgi:putative effector of murein hydrolase
VKAWFRNSLTIFWARLQIAAGVAIGVAGQAVEIMQASNAVQLMPPKWTSLALCLMGVITELARRRKEWQHDP